MPQRILQSMLREQAIKDMLTTNVPDALFAFRTKVTPYPEGIVSVWVMLALKFSNARESRSTM